MEFLNPSALIASLSLLIVIAFYLKKNTIYEKQISTISFWEEIIKEEKGIKKNKIDKYLLLITQLLICTMLILAMANPIIIKNVKSVFKENNISNKDKKILYIGNNNYLKNALSVQNIKVDFSNNYKAGYDIYICDKKNNQIPKNSSTWIINSKDKIANTTDNVYPINFENTTFLKNISNKNIYIDKTDYLKKQKNFKTILSVNEKPIMIYGIENNGRKIYSSIDFSKTNLVLSPDFPVFINNTLNWLSKENINISSQNDVDNGYSLKFVIIGLILIFTIIEYFIYKKEEHILNEKKSKIWIILRSLVYVFLILSVLNINTILPTYKTTTIFLIDKSQSTEKYKGEIENYINKEIQNKKHKDKIGIISFGKEPMVEYEVSNKLKDIKLNVDINENFTNIEKALKFAISYFPANTNKRLVLFTDGKENIGDSIEALGYLKKNNINLAIYPLKDNVKDIELTNMYIPTNIHENEIVPLNLTLNSNIDTLGKFYLYDNNTKIMEKDIAVSKGKNEITYDLQISNKDMNLKGEIDFEKDDNLKNNIIRKDITINQNPKALIIGSMEDSQNIANLLSSYSIQYEIHNPSEVNYNISYLSKFNEIFLVNVSHDEMNSELEKNLNTVVKEKGNSLIVIGGEKTFALGNYKNTLLEKMLPVSCKMKGNKKHPNTAMVIAMDCSSSMEDKSSGSTKIEMAKQAGIKCSEILDENDYIGVVGFSDKTEWIIPVQKALNKSKIKDDISKLKSQGGTLIIPALYKIKNNLENTNAKTKHIILLTDGNAEKEGYDAVISEFKKSNITLTTVAIGKDSDKALLENISKTASGRNYYASSYLDVPNIFTKETYTISKKYLNNEEFTPTFVNTDFLDTKESFKLGGYVGTGIKKNSTLILKSNLDDPILAHSKYGLGKVVVWTSDLNGKWSKDFVSSNSFKNIFGKIINYSISKNELHENIQIREDNGIVSIVSLNPKINKSYITTPHKMKKEINLQKCGNIQKGEAYLDEEGDYLISVGKTTKLIHNNYSLENNKADNISIFEDYKNINKNTSIFDIPIQHKTTSNTNLDFAFLFLALLLFIADIGIRKI